MNAKLGGLFVSAALASSALLTATSAQAITIIPMFSSGCSSDCYGLSQSDMVALTSAEQAAVVAADEQIASNFGGSMTTSIVYVGYHGTTANFLAASVSSRSVYTYDDYVTALTLDSTTHRDNTTLASAVANLQYGNGYGDPNALIATTSPNARNLGLGGSAPQFDLNGNDVGAGGVADGVVFINLDQPFTFTRPIQNVSDGVAFDAETALEHETDELLGIGGAGSTLNRPGNDTYGPMDLYRYSALNTPSYDFTNAYDAGCTQYFSSAACGSDDPSPYFSVDGGLTSIDTFNQEFPSGHFGGDAGDWGMDFSQLCPGNGSVGGSGDVQDAFGCNNRQANVAPGTASYAALEAVGYNPIPEPAIWAMMLMGVGLLGATLRAPRRWQRAALA